MTSATAQADRPLLTIEDVRRAAARLKGIAVRTPLLESEALNARVGGRLLVKAEPLQRTGSFKFRGAYNTISQVEAAAVVAYSSGNHAQGVALAARLLGKKATIVMPADAPRIKLENTKAMGAEVVTYDRFGESREAIGEEIVARTGAALVKPYDDSRIMAGQGTAGLEIAEQARELGVTIDAAAANSSGGGLIAGCGVALREFFPEIELHCAEPAGFDDHARSLSAGERLSNEPGRSSICDALLSPNPGELTFEINRRQLKSGLVVEEALVREAMRAAFRELKLVIEPGGAVALAAALSGILDCRGRTVAVVASGGNVDPALYAEILTEA
ncbi:threonine ammonia-lyase [Marinimicrococcus flavescens]|uniref:Threonine/serine dehydratase n=1 Tax=Marinimicrococcus flavescens TaxID=3031815 RepID=A0AAP3V0C4_9PROT|nr:threonine/serine dehydratase [Marinimicrococcus flavescens]